MLQVIEKEFKKLKDLVKYINKVSIYYKYLKDYKILKENDKYNLFLNFDVPEVGEILKLATLKDAGNDNHLLYDSSYDIELENRSRDIRSCICFSILGEKKFEIRADFGIQIYYVLIQIIYDDLKDYFAIELRNFDFEPHYYRGWNIEIEKAMLMKVVDYEIIYNHLVKLILNRGYLIDVFSLNELKKDLDNICRGLNKKNFN
ncbi:hypothetical protein DVV95_06120 [Clostridium botulinum]|uniref:hypothetical protein n=1 Tax=Clostridium botulinum TaxID=1491 RepID=UPI00196785EB|nr:hypothetical protein [Clostridium botulinum]MBN1061396.1 hypothetical protein [Clostridium botulinum]